MTEQRLLCDGWRFAELAPDTPVPEALEVQGSLVDIPHDFLIRDAQRLYRDADGWYVRTVPLAPPPRRTFLRFDGVYMDSTVFVDGDAVMAWKYGYTSFECELSRFAQGDSCQVALRVRHRMPNSRWYSGAGIYRDVSLIIRPDHHIPADGLYCASSRQEDGSWLLGLSCERAGGADGQFRFTVLDAEGNAIVQTAAGPAEQKLLLRGARLWDVDDPYLYTLRAELMDGGEVRDIQQIPLGLRSLSLDPDRGLFLNGRHLKIHGACQHHDLGALGAAFNEAAARRQLDSLRRMGVNAVRTAHNPAAEAWLALCDSMGMLVMSEAFDMWEQAKTQNDYARFFPDWHERDVASWVRRDRKHPCVIFWSIGNEVPDVRTPRGIELTKTLRGLVRRHDPAGHAFVTMGSNHMTDENAQRCADLLDCAGYNYAERLYESHRAAYPHWNIYGSETSSALQSRGIYHFPLSQSILADDDLQCSSLGNCAASWGAKNAQTCIIQDRDADFSLGMFIWTGTDYIGEPTPYHTRSSYFGQIDTAGFEKDAFYLYQAAWTDEPMVHILPHWDWNEGQVIDVRVCSNQPRVRLCLDDELIGEKPIDIKQGSGLYADWRMTYRPGTLRAEALDEKGHVRAFHERPGFGDAVKLVLRADKAAVKADGRDMAFIEVSAADARGRAVENALDRVRVNVVGAGRLVGLDNGDSAGRDEYKGTSRRLFSGKLLAMVMAGLEAGDIHLEAQSPGLESASLTLAAVRAPRPEGVSALERCPESPGDNEVPVRKAELVLTGSSLLTPASPSCTVNAFLRPAHHSYPDVTWRVTGVTGIESAAVRLETEGTRCRITGLSDGKVYLRCMAHNGSLQPEVISLLEIEARGFGIERIDPYGFVAAGIYTLSEGELASGNDRGVSIPPNASGVFGFAGLDFGHWGSDKISIPVFALSDGPCTLSLWEGLPGQGGKHIADLEYRKKMIWNTYQEESWTLPRRLRGLVDLCIASSDRLHVQGFRFERQERAWGRVYAAEAEGLWGDSFRREEDWVRRIGNNVALRYEGMRFGAGAKSLSISCASRGSHSAELLFEPLKGEPVRMTLPLKGGGGEAENRFDLSGIRGEGSISFIFLPGSDVDFHWFQFLQGGNE